MLISQQSLIDFSGEKNEGEKKAVSISTGRIGNPRSETPEARVSRPLLLFFCINIYIIKSMDGSQLDDAGTLLDTMVRPTCKDSIKTGKKRQPLTPSKKKYKLKMFLMMVVVVVD